MREAAEEELIHVRALMTQEVQRAAKETLAKEAFQAELNAAIRQLQPFQNQRGIVQQHRRHANSEMELRKGVEEELVQVRAEMKEEVQSWQEEKERLQGLVQAQTSLRVQACGQLEEVTKERDLMEGKVDELRDAARSAKREVESLRAKVDDAMAGKSVAGFAEMVGVSPSSMDRVLKGSQRGSLTSSVLEDASMHESANWKDETRFLKRVEKTLTPVIEKLCSGPKFKNGKTDVGGVAAMVLGKIARGKSSRRKLNFGSQRPRGVSVELDSLLKELAELWRHTFREHDRDTSARLLQVTLKAIPDGVPTVS